MKKETIFILFILLLPVMLAACSEKAMYAAVCQEPDTWRLKLFCLVYSPSKGDKCIDSSECPKGTMCENGICTGKKPAEVKCTDTDGGVDLYTEGHAEGYNPKIKVIEGLYDHCTGASELEEGVCDAQGLPAYVKISCPQGTTCQKTKCA